MVVLKRLFVICFSALLFVSVSLAQKLPDVQQKPIKIPKDLRIDGKAGEWNNKFQARNRNLAASYLIANDAVNLYLIIQADDEVIAKKMIAGGLTFSFPATNVSITYPVYDQIEPVFLSLSNIPVLKGDSAQYLTDLNQFSSSQNRQLAQLARSIKVAGITSIPDSMLSVYNEYGIRAAGSFDEHLKFCYELLIPLKYIVPEGNTTQPFNYKIRFNGGDSNGNKLLALRPDFMVVVGRNGERYSPGSKATNLIILLPTDFQGTYMPGR